MKKRFILIFAIINLLSFLLVTTASAKGFTIWVDGTKVYDDAYADEYAYIDEDGDLFIAIRPLCEAISMYASWDSDTQSLFLERDNRILMIQLNNTTALINGNSVQMEKPAIQNDWYTYVPIEFVLSQYGHSSAYDATNQILSIASNGNTPPEIQPYPYIIHNVSLADLSGNKLDSIPSQGKFMVNLNTAVNTATNETGFIIIAKYDENDLLVDYDFFSTTFNLKPIMNFSISIDQAEGTEKIKLFMWDNLRSMTPISNCIVI